MPYEDYRIQPQATANPYSLQGSPQQFYAPSDSIFGGVRKDLLRQGATGLPLTGAFDAFLAHGNPIQNLGNGANWRDFATFGHAGGKRAQDHAADMRAGAVTRYRQGEEDRMREALGQQGGDVLSDLAPELHSAVYAGGLQGDENSMHNAMTMFQQRVQQYLQGRQRGGQARQVDAIFNDPRHIQDQQFRLDAQKRLGEGNIAEDYRINMRNNAFNQARRGTQGGSTDVEKQGSIGRSRDAGALDLQNQLSQQAQDYRLGDAQQREALMGMIYNDDPNTAAAFSRQLQGINSQGGLAGEQRATTQQQNAARSATSMGYSQALGGGLSQLSHPLEYYIEHRGGGA